MKQKDGLRCPSCSGQESTVTDSRPKSATLVRRRRCTCGHKFTTVEMIINTKQGRAISTASSAEWHARYVDLLAKVKKFAADLSPPPVERPRP